MHLPRRTLLLVALLAASSSHGALVDDAQFWLTKGDGSIKLERQGVNADAQHQTIDVDDSQTYQTIDGFGFTLTGGSAEVINRLNSGLRSQLLQELFGTGENSIGISYLRLSIGASDLNHQPFTYDDIPDGQTDYNLDQFSLSVDDELIGMLNEILAINPAIQTIATPWSAPRWMKNNNNFVGGNLNYASFATYAQYFVRYVNEMRGRGVTIHAVTPQNEPLNPFNNPSMEMSAGDQADFIRNHLGPAFREAGLSTKIIVWDHNCDNTAYALDVLGDAAANQYVSGSGWHLYNGDISALSTVHNAHPDKEVLFTEQYTSTTGSFGGDLGWHVKNVIVGSVNNWARVALEWNLANDGNFEPYTPGGCSVCKGAITVHSGDYYEKNVGYYIVGHAAKFVPGGSVRVGSNTNLNGLRNAAFRTPSGGHAVIVVNDSGSWQEFSIRINGEWFSTFLDTGDVGTYSW